MLKKTILASALSLAMATSAYADSDKCASQMKSLEEAMATEKIAPDLKEKAGDLLAKAKEKQAAGDSKSCVTLLTEAEKVVTSE